MEFELFIKSFIYYYETRIDKYGVISQRINDLKAQNLMDSVLVTIKDKRAYLSVWFNNNQKLLNKFKGWIKSSHLIGTNEWYNDLLDIENNKGGHISHITLVNNHGCAIPFGDGSNFILDDINIIKLIFPLIVNEKYGKIRLYFFRYSYDKFLIMSIIRFEDNNQYKKFNKDVLLLNNQLAADKLLTIYLGELFKQSMHYILIPKNKKVSD